MSKVYEKTTDFIYWHRRLLDVAGLWPLERPGLRFYTFVLYCTIHLCGAFVDFAINFGHFGSMVENLGETGLIVMVMAKIPTMKYSSLLRKVTREILASCRAEDEADYKNWAERKIYISYSGKCLWLFQTALRIGWVATGFFYFKTLLIFMIAECYGSGPRVYLMPYHTHFFINITDMRVYILVCAYQCPMIYVFTSHGIMACFMWALIMHVCGQMSVLAFAIKNIVEHYSGKSNEQLEYAVCRIIQKHNELIRISKVLERIFRLFLLDEIAICAVVVGLVLYSLLVLDSVTEDGLLLLCYFLFILGMLMITYGWCLVGDVLRQESMNFLNACYESQWYDMPPRCQKLIIICMIRAKSPLYISAGGFYIYTLTSFTAVVKSAMTYASMLRQIS